MAAEVEKIGFFVNLGFFWSHIATLRGAKKTKSDAKRYSKIPASYFKQLSYKWTGNYAYFPFPLAVEPSFNFEQPYFRLFQWLAFTIIQYPKITSTI